MPFARPFAVAVTAALLVAVAPVPARAAGPVAVSEHVAAQAVFDLSSSADGTVFVTTGGAVRLVRAPMTPASPEVALGTRGMESAPYPGQEVSIAGGRVAIPQVPSAHGFATSVRWCLVGDCPTTSTLTAPAGYHYLGNAGDVAILHKPSTNTLGLVAWTGGAVTTVSLGTRPAPLGAYGDATGIALWHPTSAAYVARPSLAVTTIVGRRAYLTPSYVAVTQVKPTYPHTYSIARVPRATPSAAPVVEATVPLQPVEDEPRRLVATDDVAAWSTPLDWRAKRDAAPQVGALHTLVFGDSPVESGRVEWDAVAALDGGPSFVVHRGRDEARGFYAVVPGTTTATVVHTLPDVAATVRSISMSDDRMAFADDSAPGGAAYVRDVEGGVPGGETFLKEMADHVALSAPFVAVAKIGTNTAGASATDGVLAWRLGDSRRFSASPGEPTLSAFRLVSQAPSGVNRIVVQNELAPHYSRGGVVATVFGDSFYVADRNGGIQVRDLRTNVLRTVRVGTCGGDCGADRSAWRLSAWGDELVYALDLGAHGIVTGRWNATTGTTTPLPMLAAGWTRLTFRDGLLVVHRTGDGVRLYDLAGNDSALVDATGDLPSGNVLGTSLVAWRDAAGQAVVRPITDFLPSYDSTPAYLNSTVPIGAGPDLNSGGFWPAVWYVSDDDVDWTLTIRPGSASGPVVRTMTGSGADDGVLAPGWDGNDDGGDPVPQGFYAWTLTSDAGERSGTVYVSLVLPPTPTLNAPVLTSDVSATDRYTITWDGAPPGYRYRLFGPGGTLVTTAESRTYSGKGPGTFRFQLHVEDPGGRLSDAAKRVTVTPSDDTSWRARTGSWTRTYEDRHWLGSQVRSTTAGSTYSFAVRGNGIWLIGGRGPAYGRYRVTVDGRSWSYDAYSPTVKFRQVLFKLGGLDEDLHSVTVEVLPTPGRTRVGIDGIGVRRSEEAGH